MGVSKAPGKVKGRWFDVLPSHFVDNVILNSWNDLVRSDATKYHHPREKQRQISNSDPYYSYSKLGTWCFLTFEDLVASSPRVQAVWPRVAMGSHTAPSIGDQSLRKRDSNNQAT